MQPIQLRRKSGSHTGRVLFGSSDRWWIRIFSGGFGFSSGRIAFRVGLGRQSFGARARGKTPLLTLHDLEGAEHRHHRDVVKEVEDLCIIVLLRWLLCCLQLFHTNEEYLYWTTRKDAKKWWWILVEVCVDTELNHLLVQPSPCNSKPTLIQFNFP